MRLHKSLIAILAAASASAAFAQDYYVKQVEFPQGATLEEKIDMASRLVPTDKQLAWQQLELTAFLHFGMNTFTNREWGDGKEDPPIFNPELLDTDQWVKALKDAGFNLVMLTAKHHDGFCLWPTATTSHSVASSPWRDGKGDVVGDLAESCRKYGMKLGLYLSPWDRNAECYGDSPRYNDMFVAQLTELLTRYGKVDEVWFDGACGEGPNGKKQEYDWGRFKRTIETLMPDAVMAITGDDVRWVGNEKGLGRDTEWSATAFVPGILPESEQTNKALDLYSMAPDLGSRDIVAKADKLYWWPSEVDVSIRPGWFYHETEAPHSLRKLANIYVNSVGKNSVLLLNIPPDRRGLIADADVARLKELRQWIDANFTDNLAPACCCSPLQAAVKAPISAVVLGEDISKGQRVESFNVEALVNGSWVSVADGTTVGIKRILMFDQVDADSIRVNVGQSRGEANLRIMGAYNVAMPPYEAPSLAAGYAYAPINSWRAINASADAIDGNASTIWQSPDGVDHIAIDMCQPLEISGFAYTPRQDDKKDGMIYKYRFYVSQDGMAWTEVPTSGEFSNIANNPIAQMVFFESPVCARFFKLESVETVDANPYITVADLSAITKN